MMDMAVNGIPSSVAEMQRQPHPTWATSQAKTMRAPVTYTDAGSVEAKQDFAKSGNAEPLHHGGSVPKASTIEAGKG